VSLGLFEFDCSIMPFFLVAFTVAHRARCAAAIRLRAAGDIVRFLGMVLFPLLLFTFAHRAR
jgi:hypothetical protein